MKKHFLHCVIILSAVFATACNLEFPSDISIKTDATYNFSTGDIKKDFNESFDKQALFSGLETSADNKVFDYNPDGNSENCQSFILRMRLQPIDLSSLVGGLGDFVPVGFHFDDLSLPDDTHDLEMKISDIFDALDVLGDEFKTGVDFSNLPVYIFCKKPDGFSELSMSGTMKFNVKGASATEDSTLCENAPINWVEAPKAKYTADNIFLTDISKCSSSIKKDLAPFINANKTATEILQVTYEGLKLSGTTDGEDITALELYAYIELPLRFNVIREKNPANPADHDGIYVDLIKLQGKTAGEDLFGRSEATNIDDMKKFLDVMKTVNLEFITSHSPFVASKNLIYKLKNPAEGTPPAGITPASKPELDLRLNYLRDTVKFSHDDFIGLLENYPQTPSMVLELPKDTVFTVPRNVELIMKVNIMADVDGVIKL